MLAFCLTLLNEIKGRSSVVSRQTFNDRLDRLG